VWKADKQARFAQIYLLGAAPASSSAFYYYMAFGEAECGVLRGFQAHPPFEVLRAQLRKTARRGQPAGSPSTTKKRRHPSKSPFF